MNIIESIQKIIFETKSILGLTGVKVNKYLPVDINNFMLGKSKKYLRVNSEENDLEFSEGTVNNKFGDSNNYSEFEDDGTLTFKGNATVWNDIITNVANLRTGNTAPTFSAFTGGIYGLRFDVSKADEVHGSIEIPHDYKEGSDLVVHAHWSPTTTNTGNIVFGFEYSLAGDNSVFSVASNVTSIPTASPGTVNKLIRQNLLTISGLGIKIGNIITFRFYRQNGGTDTYTGNAFVHSIGIHYECDTVGSRQITSK
jgi:hypothetical protein